MSVLSLIRQYQNQTYPVDVLTVRIVMLAVGVTIRQNVGIKG